MTMSPPRLICLLILVLVAAGAGCTLQGTTSVKAAPVGGQPSRTLGERPSGPAYVAPQLAIGQEGTLYLLWLAIEPRKSWDVLFARSEDFGATWLQAPVSLKPDKTTVAGGIRIVAGPSGNVYVMWREWETKTKQRTLVFMRSTDRGRHWDGPTHLRSPSIDLGLPELLADQGGGIFVAWLAGPSNWRVLEVVSSQDAGATFASNLSELTAASPTSLYGITNHRIASDGAGRLYVVWEEIKTLGDHRIYLSRSLDQGKTWATQAILPARVMLSTPDESTYRASRPQVQAMPDGRVYVVWEQGEYRPDRPYQPGEIRKPDRVIYLSRSLDYGQTWLPQPIRLNEVGQSRIESLSPQLSADHYGNVYVTWIEEEGAGRGRLLFARSADSGLTWSAPVVRLDLTSPFTGWPAYPVIRSDGAGHVWVIWQVLAPSPKGWQLLMNRSEDHGESWRKYASVLTRPAQSGGSFRGVSFLSDMQGRLYVTWDGGSENSAEIAFNRSTDFGATWLSGEVLVGRQ